MELNKSHIWSAVAGIAVGVAIVLSMRACNKSLEPEPEPIVLMDTIRVTDTLRITEHTKPLYVIKWDTLYLENPASPDIAMDSLCDGYVTIPITQKEYRDTFATDSSRIELGVLFSGYKAKIDSIDLQYRFEVQPRVKVQKRGWGWCVMPSVQAGYGVAFGGNVIAAPYVGVGVSVGFGYYWR